MRWIFVTLTLIVTTLLFTPLRADLIDWLPLARIERNVLYPYTAARMAEGSAAQSGMRETTLTVPKAELLIWYSPPRNPDGPVVLYLHGNAGTLANRAARFELFRANGFGVVAPALRGGAGSSGTPSEDALIADALAVLTHIPALMPSKHPTDVILYGESLGTAVALGAVAHLPAEQRPAGVILEAPFTSIPEMGRQTMDLPETLIARIRDTWDSLSRAEDPTSPLLVIHGSADEVTPPQMGRQIFAAAATQDKDLVIVQGASHSGTWTGRAQKRIWRFIRAYGK